MPDSSDLLLTHASGLRQLARALLRDAQDAEDVLQETFAVALERKPDRLAKPGPWLRQVLRSVVHKRLRSDTHRRDREAATTQHTRSADPLDLVARGELIERVVAAVQSLAPTLREVILLRHFEGLPPREIARRTGTPLATISSRLQRAHAQLRAQLDEDGDGPWMPALMLSFGLDREGTLVANALTTGVLTVTSAALYKWGTAAAVVCVSVLLWQAQEPEALVPATVLEPATVETAQLAAPATAPPHERRGEVALAAPPVPLAIDPLPYAYHLRAHAIDKRDLPVQGAMLFLAPPGVPANLIGGTDDDGVIEARWFARDPELEIDWSLVSGKTGTHLQRISMKAGETFEVAGSMRAGSSGEEVLEGLSRRERRAVERKLQQIRREARWHGDPDWRNAGFPPRPFDPGVRYLDPTLQARTDDLDGLRFISRAAEFDEIDDHNETSEEEPRRTDYSWYSGSWTIHGRVMRPDGSPAADVPIGYRTRLSAMRFKATDAGGFYELHGASSGELVLLTGGGQNGIASRTLTTLDDESYLWNPVLDRGHELRGGVLLADGAPAVGWWVEVSAIDPDAAFADRTLTDAEGRYSIPNCPKLRLRVTTRPADSNCSAPWDVQDGVLASIGELPLQARFASDASIDFPGVRGLVLDEVRLVHEDSGAVSWMQHSDESWKLEKATPGRYHLEVLAGLHGFVRGPSFDVYAEQNVVLESVIARPP
ncbi:MAG: hypothetical protein DRJ42_31315, partial [Deltaproteobacteria bacterium]